jgi:hypothetical protein
MTKFQNSTTRPKSGDFVTGLNFLYLLQVPILGAPNFKGFLTQFLYLQFKFRSGTIFSCATVRKYGRGMEKLMTA